MRRPYQRYLEEEKGRLKMEFEASNPHYWGALQGRSDDIERVKAISDHTNDAIRSLEEEFIENRHERVARQAVEVWNERTRHYDYLAPHVRAQLMSENSILEEARKRDDSEHQKALETLLTNEEEAVWHVSNGQHFYGQSFSKKEIETMTTQEKQTHFKAELHKLVEDSEKARFQVSKIVNNERERMLDEARDSGSDDPNADVKSVVSSMYKGVQEKLHSDIHALFLKYGYAADKQQVEFYANSTSSEIAASQTAIEFETDSQPAIESGVDIDPIETKPSQDDDQSQ